VTPNPTENVIAYKRDAGRVTVHGWRKQRFSDEAVADAMTDCGRTPEWQWRSWMWLEFRTLNPERAVLCKRCWEGEQK
jgi:hypothetical protein